MREAKPARTTRSRQLRKNSTLAENRLWYRVRNRELSGLKFVRQEPIGPYTIDFICREARLVIELDGGQHAGSESDRARDSWLVQHNYRVLRFWNNDVIKNIEGVFEAIVEALRTEAPPHPDRCAIRPLPASGER
jgi:very-short-patch-repair endonuclease